MNSEDVVSLIIVALNKMKSFWWSWVTWNRKGLVRFDFGQWDKKWKVYFSQCTVCSFNCRNVWLFYYVGTLPAQSKGSMPLNVNPHSYKTCVWWVGSSLACLTNKFPYSIQTKGLLDVWKLGFLSHVFNLTMSSGRRYRNTKMWLKIWTS